MNPIIQNYLIQLKKKQLSEYTVDELDQQLWHLQTLYTFSDNKEDKLILRGIYTKVVEWLNSQRKGTMFNPASLDHIDRDKREGKLV